MRPRLIVGLAVLAVGLLAYGASLRLPLLDFDDPVYVTGSPFLRAPAGTGLTAAWRSSYFHDYIPVTHTTLWIDRRLWGDAAFGYRLQSLSWHLAAALLAGWVLGRFVRDGRVGAGVAVIFAAHPLAVESVAWVSSRKNVVSLALLFAALAVFQRATDRLQETNASSGAFRAAPAAWGAFFFAGSLFVLSLLAKSTSIIFPALAALDAWARGRMRPLRAALLAAPFAGIALVGMLLTLSLRFDQPEARLGGSLGAALVADIPIAAHYVLAALRPARLALFYAVHAGSHLGGWEVLGASALLLAMLAVPFAWIRRRREAASLLVWSAIGFLPAANLVPQPHPVSDRFFYGSLPALIAFYVLAALDGWDRVSDAVRFVHRRFVPAFALGAASVALAWVARGHAGLFGSSRALFEDAVRKNPDSSIANLHLGNVLMQPGASGTQADRAREDRAAKLFQAMFSAPDAADLVKTSARDRASQFLATWHHARGRSDEADRLMRERFGGREGDPSAVLAWAQYEAETGRDALAAGRLESALFGERADGRPSVPGLRDLRARLMASTRLPWDSSALLSVSATDVYRRGQEAKGLLEALRLLARSYRRLGRAGEALGVSLVAAAVAPDEPAVLAELEADYRAAGDEASARAVAARAASRKG